MAVKCYAFLITRVRKYRFLQKQPTSCSNWALNCNIVGFSSDIISDTGLKWWDACTDGCSPIARKRSLTFMAVLAEVSINSRPVSSAYVWASWSTHSTTKNTGKLEIRNGSHLLNSTQTMSQRQTTFASQVLQLDEKNASSNGVLKSVQELLFLWPVPFAFPPHLNRKVKYCGSVLTSQVNSKSSCGRIGLF